MRSLDQIVKDNGGDNTPGLDTHNLTGRAAPKEVEPQWVPLERETCGHEVCDMENCIFDQREDHMEKA